MHLRSLALVWAVLLVPAIAVFQNVSFGPSSPQVQLLPPSAWTFVKPENTNIPQYAFTDVEGAQAFFTFPRACRVGQPRLFPPTVLTLPQITFTEPGVNFFWRGYPSEIGKWGLCIDCKAGGTGPTDHLEILFSGAKQVRPDAPSVRHLFPLSGFPKPVDDGRGSPPQALTTERADSPTLSWRPRSSKPHHHSYKHA